MFEDILRDSESRAAIARIERDLALMLEKVSRIEEVVTTPPMDRDDDVEMTDPPF